MLTRLMMRFGATAPQAAQSLQAAAPGSATSPDRARSRRPPTRHRLVVDDTFDRAWRRVGLALDRIGFTVVDRDRSKGVYFVRYANPDLDGGKKDTGFLSKLMFWKETPRTSRSSIDRRRTGGPAESRHGRGSERRAG